MYLNIIQFLGESGCTVGVLIGVSRCVTLELVSWSKAIGIVVDKCWSVAASLTSVAWSLLGLWVRLECHQQTSSYSLRQVQVFEKQVEPANLYRRLHDPPICRSYSNNATPVRTQSSISEQYARCRSNRGRKLSSLDESSNTIGPKWSGRCMESKSSIQNCFGKGDREKLQSFSSAA